MSNKKYDKPARPFEISNIGNYEMVHWQEKVSEEWTWQGALLRLKGYEKITFFIRRG